LQTETGFLGFVGVEWGDKRKKKKEAEVEARTRVGLRLEVGRQKEMGFRGLWKMDFRFGGGRRSGLRTRIAWEVIRGAIDCFGEHIREP
jgi:hypothetical protein